MTKRPIPSPGLEVGNYKLRYDRSLEFFRHKHGALASEVDARHGIFRIPFMRTARAPHELAIFWANFADGDDQRWQDQILSLARARQR
jgi:hypothetical protein